MRIGGFWKAAVAGPSGHRHTRTVVTAAAEIRLGLNRFRAETRERMTTGSIVKRPPDGQDLMEVGARQVGDWSKNATA